MLTLRFTTRIDMSDPDFFNDVLDEVGGSPADFDVESSTRLIWTTTRDYELTLFGNFKLPPANPTPQQVAAFLASPVTQFRADDPDGDLYYSFSGLDGATYEHFSDGTWRNVLASQILNDGVTIISDRFNDLLIGDVEDDVLIGNGGNDDLRGLNGDDAIGGGPGNDKLNGGNGNDVMTGGTGNDTYSVSSAGDEVKENAGEGTDLVLSTRTFTLPANVENLTLQGTTNLNGAGNGLANRLVGNSANNTLSGVAGHDILDGEAGADLLKGGTGNDTLNGGTGNDALNGEDGNDSLSGSAGLDKLSGGAGNDSLNGGDAADTLSGGTGNDTLSGAAGSDILNGEDGNDSLNGGDAADTLNGAAGSDQLLGGSGNDILNGSTGLDKLDGGTGADTMNGGADSDRYFVDNAQDKVIESVNAGTDRVISSISLPSLPANVENVLLTGSANLDAGGNLLDNDMVGNAGNNVLSGRKGNDTIHLGQGADRGTGGDGDDRFVLDAAGGADTITDFAPGRDTLVLENGIFTQLGAGALHPGRFILTTGTPAGGDDYLVYDQGSGNLYYDAAGTGNTAILIATFSNGAALTAADIEVI